MYRLITCLGCMLASALLLAPAYAQDGAAAAPAADSAPVAAPVTTAALLSGAKLDLPTLLLASQVLKLLQEDQAGFDGLLSELVASGDITEAGAAKLRTWLADAGTDYVALLSPAGSVAQAGSAFVGPLPGATSDTTSRQAGAVALPVGSQQPAAHAGQAPGPGISLSADGTVQVQGVEQLLGLAGLGQIAEAASASGVVLELDPKNVGVYIPLTVNGTAVSAGQMQINGMSGQFQEMLRNLTPAARIYTVPTSWKEDAGAAWDNLCELVKGKKKPAADKEKNASEAPAAGE
jgi:hypothetical protein